MQFTDLYFVFIFLPALLGIYYIIHPRYRVYVLIVFSLFFYAYGSLEFFNLLLLILLVDVALGNLLILLKQKNRLLARFALIFGVLLNIGILGYFKYYNFIVININRCFSSGFETKNILLPLGLSFFTFKAISYLADAYSGKIKNTGFLQPFSYLSFFGQIQSGPIARYHSFDKETVKYDAFFQGITKFMVGFSEKVILSDILNNITCEIYDKTSVISTPLVWLASVCYSLQLYFDFSGYSNMAIGICNMLGYDCPDNFNYPYMSKSISEFWRRWHITLGAWFRDYVYIPLGGSRVRKSRLYFNLFIVWFLTGLWHGAAWHFVIWGVGYFILISLEKTWHLPDRLPNTASKTLYRVLVLFLINFQWVLFRSNDVSQAILFLKAMCGMHNHSNASRALFLLKDYGLFILIMAILFSTPLIKQIEQIFSKNKKTKLLYDAVYVVATIVTFIIAISFIISGQNNPFLYGNF